jgi:hypothetical protein
VTAVEALGLRCGNFPLFVEVTYGNQSQVSNSCPASDKPTWSSHHNDGHGVEFNIDMNNWFLDIHVNVIAENFPNNIKVAYVRIPLFSLLDCLCCLPNEETWFDRWFPMILYNASDIVGSDPRYADQPRTSEKVNPKDLQKHTPRIHLMFRLKPLPFSLPMTSFYVSIRFPAISMSVLNSAQRSEICLLTVRRTDVRGKMNASFFDIAGSIGHLQIDNQLQDPISEIILCPTFVKRPQPVFRFNL